MRIAIVGAGGVGGYFGGRLAAAGADVAFVARGRHLAALREHGLTIESALGNVTAAVRAEEDPAAIGPVDLVMIAVKLWDTDEVVRQIVPLVSEKTALLSLQNGIEKDEILRAAFGAERTLGALCYIGAAIERPGVIRHNGTLQKLVFGEFGGTRSERVSALFELCGRAGIDANVSDDIARETWEKFVFLVGFSGATSAIRQPIGPIRSDTRARAFLGALFAETVDVGRALGAGLAEDFAAARLAFCDTMNPTFSSSMAGDLDRGNRLEWPWLQGVVSQRGREHGIATPANDFVCDVLSVYVNGPPAAVTA